MRKLDDLDKLLGAWGHWYGVRDRPALDADGYQLPPGPRVTGSHPIARAMEFAPGRKASRETLQRGGEARRRTMALAAGLPGLLPVAYVDHIPCTETRPHLGTPRWPTDPDPIPVAAQRIEAAVRGLVLSEPAWGYALRARYCQRGEGRMAGRPARPRVHPDRHGGRGTLRHDPERPPAERAGLSRPARRGKAGPDRAARLNGRYHYPSTQASRPLDIRRREKVK